MSWGALPWATVRKKRDGISKTLWRAHFDVMREIGEERLPQS
jgi:hypothetical protein